MRSPSNRQRGSAPYRRANGGASSSRQGNSSGSFRPAFTVTNADPGTSRTLRWAGSVTSTASLVVTRANLLSAIVTGAGFIATSASLAYVPIYESVRIRRARIILPPPTNAVGGTITQEVSIEWSSYLGKDVKWSVSGASSLGGIFSCRPPKGTRASMWGSANTSANAATSINEVLFAVNHDGNFANPASTVNCVVELDLDFVQANDTSSLLAVTATAITAAQAAGIYQCPLDLIAPSGAIGNRRFDPLGVQDVRMDSAGNAITFTAVTRTN